MCPFFEAAFLVFISWTNVKRDIHMIIFVLNSDVIIHGQEEQWSLLLP